MIHKQVRNNKVFQTNLKKAHAILIRLPDEFCKQDVEQLWIKCYGKCSSSTIYNYINFLDKINKIKCINNTFHHKMYKKIK